MVPAAFRRTETDTFEDHSAAITARTPTVTFAEATARITPHVLYLGHADYLALRGTVTVEVEINLIAPGSIRIATTAELLAETHAA